MLGLHLSSFEKKWDNILNRRSKMSFLLSSSSSFQLLEEKWSSNCHQYYTVNWYVPGMSVHLHMIHMNSFTFYSCYHVCRCWYFTISIRRHDVCRWWFSVRTWYIPHDTRQGACFIYTIHCMYLVPGTSTGTRVRTAVCNGYPNLFSLCNSLVLDSYALYAGCIVPGTVHNFRQM